MEIPKFEDFAELKERERLEKVWSNFQTIFHDNIKSVKDIGKEHVITYADYTLITTNDFLIRSMNDLGWDFIFKKEKGVKCGASYPVDIYIIVFNELKKG